MFFFDRRLLAGLKGVVASVGEEDMICRNLLEEEVGREAEEESKEETG